MRQENSNRKQRLTVKILVTIVTILVLFIAFFFVAQPQMQNYDTKRQIEGYEEAIRQVLTGVQNQGFVGIPISENETVNLVPVEACPQIVAAQAQQ